MEKVGENQRMFEKVGVTDSSRRFEKVGEGWRRPDKVG